MGSNPIGSNRKARWCLIFRDQEEKGRYMAMLDALKTEEDQSRGIVVRSLIKDAYHDLEGRKAESEEFLAELRRTVPKVIEKYPNTLKLLENS